MESSQGNRLLLKPFFYLSVKIFSITFVLGALVGWKTDMFIPKMIGNISVISVFSHNFSLNIIEIFGGFLFGSIPLGILIANGICIGYIITALQIHHSLPFLTIPYGIIPHAVPELFSFFFSSALGLRLGFLCYRNYFGTAKCNIKKEFAISLLWLPLIAASTYLAAYIETNISKALLERIFH